MIAWLQRLIGSIEHVDRAQRDAIVELQPAGDIRRQRPLPLGHRPAPDPGISAHQLQKLDLRDGDVVVVTPVHGLSPQAADQLMEQFSEYAGVKVIILPPGWRCDTMGRAEAARLLRDGTNDDRS